MTATIKRVRLHLLTGGMTNIEIDIDLPFGTGQTIQIYDTLENLKSKFELSTPKSIMGRNCQVEEYPQWRFIKYLN